MSKEKVLIIEDDLIMGKTIQNVLESNQFDAFLATNGATGIQKAFEINPDLILCDLVMKPIDGFQVFHILKGNSHTELIPFIFLSSKSEISDIRLGLEMGADDYIIKPFNNYDLIKSVEIRIGKYKRLLERGRSEFNTLINLSPNGIFLFDGHNILKSNRSFKQMLELDEEYSHEVTLKTILTDESYDKIKSSLVRCKNGIQNRFQEEVSVKTRYGTEKRFSLFVAPIKKSPFNVLLMSILVPVKQNNINGEMSFRSNRLKDVLSKDNIKVTDELIKKIDAVSSFDMPGSNGYVHFSKRENEVLKLSSMGFPIKVIADKLNISSRTVEKHRANLMKKTGLSNIVEVIVFSLRNKLIEI